MKDDPDLKIDENDDIQDQILKPTPEQKKSVENETNFHS